MTMTHAPSVHPKSMVRRMRSWRVRHIAAMLAIAAGLSCNQLTNIDAPDLLSPVSLDNATGATARYAGAISDFAAAYSDQVAETGLIADEFQDVGGNPTSSDRRVIALTNFYPFAALSRARISALRAIATLERAAPAPPQRIGELHALVGFIEMMLAEGLCTPVPLATVVDGLPTAAPPYSRDALLASALAAFDAAAAHADTSGAVANLARVGRARVLLFRGDLDSAAAAVVNVPMAFVYQASYSASTSGQTNTVYNRIGMGRYVTVADREGSNGLPFISGTDSRVGAYSLGSSRVGLPLYNFAKNGSLGAPITLASGVEAALIQAEAALARGDVPAWAALLNALRQTAISPALPPLPDDSTTNASPALRLDVLFKERAFWLFGTGHRHGDLRRLIRHYGRDPERTFPTGEYAPTPGVRYGADVTFVPAGEEPNAGYFGCEDRGA